MVPLASVVRVRETTSPQVISHFNLFRSAEINGSAAPGTSSGQALQEMQNLAATALPQGFGYAWSGISLEEIKAGRQSAYIFGIGLLLVYLTLAAQYESLVLPFIVLLGVPLAVLGALSAAVMAISSRPSLLAARPAAAASSLTEGKNGGTAGSIRAELRDLAIFSALTKIFRL